MEPASFAIGGLGPVALFAVSLGLLGSIFWIWMLAEVTTKESERGNTKMVWTGVIVFTNFVGAALYFMMRRPKRRAAAAA